MSSAPTTRPFRNFLLGLIVVSAALVLACLASFRLQAGTFTKETLSRCAGAEAKYDALDAMSGKRLIFVGGSAVHKGINTAMVTQATGQQAANLGTFATLGPELMLWNTQARVRPGDTVVLAFEYDLFWHNRPTAAEIDFVIGCAKDYADSLSLVDQLTFALGAELQRPLTAHRISPADELRRQKLRLTASGDARFIPLNFETLSATELERLALYQPLAIRFDRNSRDVRAITRFVQWARANEVTVLATWPNTLYFDSYRDDPALQQIAKYYQDVNVPMIGTPQQAMAPLSELHNTQYHLNEKGIVNRTERLISALKPVLAKANAQQ